MYFMAGKTGTLDEQQQTDILKTQNRPDGDPASGK